MNNNSSAEQIVEALTSIAEKLRRLASQEKITDEKRLVYKNALDKVKEASAALEQLKLCDL